MLRDRQPLGDPNRRQVSAENFSRTPLTSTMPQHTTTAYDVSKRPAAVLVERHTQDDSGVVSARPPISRQTSSRSCLPSHHSSTSADVNSHSVAAAAGLHLSPSMYYLYVRLMLMYRRYFCTVFYCHLY